MATAENPHAGQGAVVLDIGGDVGALVVTMPPELDGVEVEIVPTGTDERTAAHHHLHHAHDEPHSHGGAPHTHAPGAPPHVAVVARPTPDGAVIHSLVYPDLVAGTYDLYIRPDGPIALTATVAGGEITETVWPATDPMRN